jgi:hypothetical protein
MPALQGGTLALTRILVEQRLRLRRKPVSDNTMISIRSNGGP